MDFSSTQDYMSRIKRTIISADEIKNRINDAGKFIDSIYNGRPVLLVSILKGSFIFLADLARTVSVPCEIDFMAAKSYYESTDSSGVVQITMDLRHDVSGYHVIMVEDIIDTGRTLTDVLNLLKARKPLSLHVVTLLDKPERRSVPLKADLSLFTIPDLFVIGYGLDYDQKYRNLPYIGVVELD